MKSLPSNRQLWAGSAGGPAGFGNCRRGEEENKSSSEQSWKHGHIHVPDLSSVTGTEQGVHMFFFLVRKSRRMLPDRLLFSVDVATTANTLTSRCALMMSETFKERGEHFTHSHYGRRPKRRTQWSKRVRARTCVCTCVCLSKWTSHPQSRSGHALWWRSVIRWS